MESAWREGAQGAGMIADGAGFEGAGFEGATAAAAAAGMGRGYAGARNGGAAGLEGAGFDGAAVVAGMGRGYAGAGGAAAEGFAPGGPEAAGGEDEAARQAGPAAGGGEALRMKAQALLSQAEAIRAVSGVDVMALFDTDVDVRGRVLSGEWDFVDVWRDAGGRAEPPAPVRAPNGGGLGGMNIGRMDSRQFEKLDAVLRQGGTLDMRW
ncbi:MAG: hypothetical protein MR842_13245 [Clostridiales bacterium]|nr:hypothetical protein [Clostridiales bacterium]